MLELRDIKKIYKVGEHETYALNGVSMAFREKEFVAILGESGSGKTTCLNIIGGLDRYDSGELTIKGKTTADFKDSDWDAYRNNSIGFVFQSYNLISHLSIVKNVELGMTLSGVSSAEKRERATEVLIKVGLEKHLYKRPNQLSGGQMQRVAIARALANNPEILLCDEPTGALDSATSIQIMDLIRDLSKERLVIMVTHNPQIAEDYADRVITLSDGEIVSDTNPHAERDKPDMFKLKKTAMSFFTALNLSGNNILTKKGRTFLTAFASSIGIIGIAVILSLSNGFQLQIDKFQEDAMSQFPIVISQHSMEMNQEEIAKAHRGGDDDDNKAKPTEVSIFDPGRFFTQHTSVFSPEYLEYIQNIDPDYAAYIGYQRMISVNAMRSDDGVAKPITFPSIITMMTGGGNTELGGDMTSMFGGGGIGLSTFPVPVEEDAPSYMEANYELLSGEFPNPDEPTEVLMIIDRDGELDKSVLDALGFDTNRDTVSFDEILNTEFKLINNNEYYAEISDVQSLIEMMMQAEQSKSSENEGEEKELTPEEQEKKAQELIASLPEPIQELMATGQLSMDDLMAMVMKIGMSQMGGQDSDEQSQQSVFMPRVGLAEMSNGEDTDAVQAVIEEIWNSKNNKSIKITGIVRAKEDSGILLLLSGIVYSDDMLQLIIENAQDSDIVKAQLSRESSVFPSTGQEGITLTRDLLLSTLGADDAIVAITVYPKDFESKDKLRKYLDKWNEGKVCICAPCEQCKIVSKRCDECANLPQPCENCKDLPEKCDECMQKECGMVIYTDLATEILGFMSDITEAITVVLIAFASISLVVSLIMIMIITYISVLERTKEIGILRALGARKKDITRVFNAETFIIGVCSGTLGVLIAWLLTFPANMIIEDMTNLPDVAQLNPLHALFLLALSTALTVIGGFMPALSASKKNAVESLRSE